MSVLLGKNRIKQIVNLTLSLILFQVIAKKTSKEQLYPLIETLQEGLMDFQSHSSSGACVVLNGLMKQRGSELFDKVG